VLIWELSASILNMALPFIGKESRKGSL